MTSAIPLTSILSAALLMLALSLGRAHADYEPVRLPALIGESELIVLGAISEVREKTFVLTDYDVIFGSRDEGPLEVGRFVDWSGASRWTAYRAGQTLLLFLSAPATAGEEGEPQPWRIRGIGAEGEMPVENGLVYTHGPVLGRSGIQKYTVDQGTLYGRRFDLETFVSAITGFKRCFRLVRADDAETNARTFLQLCDDEALDAYRRESELHRELVDAAK
jgi:hypothetical protein